MRGLFGLRLFVAALVVAGVAAGAALAAGKPGATNANGGMKFTLYQGGAYSCPTFTLAFPGSASASTAVLQYDKTLSQVGATVTLKGAAANTTYDVTIVQDGCTLAPGGSFTTNGGGNGSLNVSVPAAGTNAAVYAVNVGNSDDYYLSEPIYIHA